MERHSSRDERDAAHANPEEINQGEHYAMYSVFTLDGKLPAGEAAELANQILQQVEPGVTLRGCYDISGFRADSDLMFWTLSDDVTKLQSFYQSIRRSRLGSALKPFWTSVAIHQPAEFNKSHVPAALAGFAPRPWITVYPFVRSYEWYYMSPAKRSAMLREHGEVGRRHPEVIASTLAAFSLGDYEWILAFEADELHSLVESMRNTRETEARQHVRVETPFFTGPRVELAEWIESQPRNV